MTHKLIKTENYLLVVDDSVHPYDSSKVGNPLAHLPLNGSPILKDVLLLPPIEDDFEKFLDRDFEFGFTSKHTVDRIKWYYQTYFKEKYKYTEEDVIRLIEKSRATGLSSEYLIIASQYPTEFECEMEYYYYSSTTYYHDAGFVKCDESQYNSIRRTIPECETKVEPKTIITAQGVELVGKYK
jgi:hypothetical protein